MFKLALEKAEEPQIKLPTSAGSWENQEGSRKTSISALLTMPKALTVWITINWKILKEMGIPDHLICLLRNLYASQEETVRTGHGTVSDFILGGSKITADGYCNHEIKRLLLLERKVMTNLHSILNSRDITLPTKVHLVKAMVFPVVMYGCESWTVKKTEHRRIDAFELWCWRRLLRFPCTARRSNQSILKEISPGWSLEGLMLKLKLQYFDYLMRRADSFEKTLMLGKIEGRRRRG